LVEEPRATGAGRSYFLDFFGADFVVLADRAGAVAEAFFAGSFLGWFFLGAEEAEALAGAGFATGFFSPFCVPAFAVDFFWAGALAVGLGVAAGFWGKGAVGRWASGRGAGRAALA